MLPTPLTKLFPAYFSPSESVLPSQSISQISHSPFPTTPFQSTPQVSDSLSSPPPQSIRHKSSTSSPIPCTLSTGSSHSSSSSSFSPPTQEILEPTVVLSPADGLRRSSHTHNALSYLSDYICDKAFSVISPNPTLMPLHSFSFNSMSPQNQHIVNSICQIIEPVSYQQAAFHPAWQAAMNKELEALESNHTWDLVPLPVGKKALHCK